jgi:hypothetical protein
MSGRHFGPGFVAFHHDGHDFEDDTSEDRVRDTSSDFDDTTD